MRRNPDLWHTTFDLCADFLHWLASKLDPIWPGGMDYVKLDLMAATGPSQTPSDRIEV